MQQDSQQQDDQQRETIRWAVAGGSYGEYSEARFLAIVRELHRIGYGRMLQIVEHEWYRAAAEKGDPVSGVLVHTECLGTLTPEKRAEFVAGFTNDPLFR